jgi:hypothetical protein
MQWVAATVRSHDRCPVFGDLVFCAATGAALNSVLSVLSRAPLTLPNPGSRRWQLRGVGLAVAWLADCQAAPGRSGGWPAAQRCGHPSGTCAAGLRALPWISWPALSCAWTSRVAARLMSSPVRRRLDLLSIGLILAIWLTSSGPRWTGAARRGRAPFSTTNTCLVAAAAGRSDSR